VSLNWAEEIWQLIESSYSSDPCPDLDSGEDFMHLSISAAQGTDTAQTIRLVGTLFQQPVVLLLDSGSSSSFVSQSLAAKLPHWTPLSEPGQVRVANGNILQCTHELLDCPLTIQGHCFSVNLKILPLMCYDIILGMDWLE
jgi:hypothetical protein